MITCGGCGADCAEDAKFCSECGAHLQTGRAVARERKVVTSLFCDLVAFTAMSEAADPEDVDAILGRYFTAARAAIESFGGTVEKFIGDAVVGVFGVPAAHEDDPERAVRAGLRIVEAVEGLVRPDGSPLELRVGINTGEAVVRLDVTPGSGEGFLTGDAVNTAARIQSVAPVMGVAVGRSTYEATKPVFDYVELPPATVKGKSDPVEVWHAVVPLARFGTDVTRRHDTPLVGREIDLALLKGAFDKTAAAQTPQLVTVVGEPGLGKSRLVAELFNHVDAQPGLVTWRQGRCLPYGEGITFWALGEIIKAHAGIFDTDAADVAEKKLDAVLPDVEERAWLKQRLLPLLGIEATSRAEQPELFTAWRRFIESIAEAGPTVVVFEDLHWGDPALLAFVEHLADHAEGVSLLIVGTARPELYERYPDYGRGLRNTNTVSLGPLSEGETTHLVNALLQTLAIPDDLRLPLVQRVGGNPLFAEEYVRLLQDRALLERVDDQVRLRAGVELPLPDTVQSVIAARLDTLEPERKALLADAAVVGKVFWAGAVAAMSQREEAEVVEVMRELSRKELIRPVRGSSMTGQTEYAFWHVLTCDVAYAQLPRSSRSARHLAVAQWIEAQAGDRVEDQADVLAHHYAMTLDLALAAGDDSVAEQVRPSTARFLLLAGERAVGMDATAGMAQLQQAVSLIPDGDPLRGRALASYGKAAFHTLHLDQARKALDEAVVLLREAGDVSMAVDALFELAKFLRGRGDPEWWTPYPPMLDMIADLPPGPVHVRVFTYHAAYNTLRGVGPSGVIEKDQEAAIDYADRALVLADRLGLDVPAEALGWRGHARAVMMGDPGGMDDIEEAIRLGTPTGQRFVAIMYNNLAAACFEHQGSAEYRSVLERGVTYAEAHGLTEMAIYLNRNLLFALLNLGAIDELFALAEKTADQLVAHGDDFGLVSVRDIQIRALVLRGEAERAAPWLDELLAARAFGDVDVGLVGLAAVTYAALGQRDAALRIFTELSERPDIHQVGSDPDWTRALVALQEIDLAEQLLVTATPFDTWSQHGDVTCRAVLSEARGHIASAVTQYADAARRWHDFTGYREEAFALLGQGRCLLALLRPDEAVPAMEQARDMFAKMGARPALEETEALLASVR